MKNLTSYVWFLAVALFFTSCSKDEIEEFDTADLSAKVVPLAYSSIELEVLDLVNVYRSQNGLTELEFLDDISRQAISHNDHMVESDEVCHHDFPSRYSALVNKVRAKSVSENVAFGYRTADAVVNAWIKSEGHQKNILGDHTHFGISVKEDKEGKQYYTNIFVKK